jgi:hypothetical protein
MDKPTSIRVRRRGAQADAQASNVVQFARPKLVPAAVCRETAELLGELLVEVLRGEVLGIAVVSIYKQRRLALGTTGEATRSPTFTLGAVTLLQADITKKIEDNNS